MTLKENLALDVSSDLEFVLEVFLGPPLPTPSLACAAKNRNQETKAPTRAMRRLCVRVGLDSGFPWKTKGNIRIAMEDAG